MIHSHLHTEIHQQPQVIEELLKAERDSVEALAREIADRRVQFVVIAARGSSDNAAIYGQYILGAMCGFTVALATPSLYTLYDRPPNVRHALVIGISQSGQSPDVVAVLSEAARQGAVTAAITNTPSSPLGQTVEHVINCRAGEERSIAATKTYTAELAALALLCAVISGERQHLEDLMLLPQALRKVLDLDDEVSRAVQRYRYMDRCMVVARGYNYANAFEIALKLKELAYVVAEPYSSADLLHGPVAVIDRGFPVVLIATKGKALSELLNCMDKLRELRAELIVISDDTGSLARANTAFAMDVELPEWLTPIVSVVPGQFMTLHLAIAKGYDPDRPRGLSKVTLTH